MFGIDLGTASTCAAIAIRKEKPVVCNFGGKYTFPSAVTFIERKYYVGHSTVQK